MILVGMEESGEIRRALRARGLEAYSCDLKPSADNSPYHIQDDIFTVARSKAWKRAIIHPVCRYLTHAGVKHLFINHGQMPLHPCMDRWGKMQEAAAFFKALLALPFPVVLENPRMHPYALREIFVWPFCTTQPWHHGDKAFKETMFWSNDRSFTPLKDTNRLEAPKHGTEEYKHWSQVFRMPPGDKREEMRSKTYPGIAKAVAEQWF